MPTRRDRQRSEVSFPVMNGRQQPTSHASPTTRPEDPWTVGRLLTWTTDYLKRHGSESPRLDAEVMLAHVLDWQRVQLYTHFEEEVSQASRTAFRELVRRRSEGAPVAYLVGRKEFYSLTLRGLAGRADSASGIGIRGRRIPGASPATCRSALRRRCGDRLGLPGDRLGAPPARESVRGHRCFRGGPGGRPAERRPDWRCSTGSIFDSATSSSRSPERARSTRSSPTPLIS